MIAAILCATLAATPVEGLKPTSEEMAKSRDWLRTLVAAPPGEPFSFVYGGQSSRLLMVRWTQKSSHRALDRQRTEWTITRTDPATGLEVRCVAVQYADFPTVEWTLYLRNTGRADTPIIEKLLPLDVQWQVKSFLLHHNIGSPASKSDYGPLETPLGPGVVKRIGAAGGRPTNSDMSYFNLETSVGEGTIVVVGWPGQWSSEFARDAGDGLHVTAGQELTHFSLHPGEEVRTPLIVLQAWRGDWLRGQNLWRRWMMAHSMPRPGGKLPPPQLVASSSRAYEEMKGANEANQIMHIDRYLQEGLKLDYWWMDAGWYVQQQGWPQVGTWEVDRTRFPNGFKPISDHAHAKGVKTLVWFEPERVAPGTWLYEKHPEWLLSADPGRSKAMAGLLAWRSQDGPDPCVNYNSSDRVITLAGIRWEPGQLSFHPGSKGEYSVVRWSASAPGDYKVAAAFLGIDEKTTTDVHVLHNGRPLFDSFINLGGYGRRVVYEQSVPLKKGDHLDFVVGWGNGSHICDSTGLDARITGPDGRIHDAAKEFSPGSNPNVSWQYGRFAPGAAPNVRTFQLYTRNGSGDDGQQKLLNLGNDEARRWLTDHVHQLLTENGIDLYRQDFNIDPLAFWRANDAPDRQGITEIKHVTGYLAYWDDLRRRHPNMLIDSCASGGRRNDLETMRRAVPLWRSDYAFEPTGHQCMTYGISLWLPYHGTGTVASTQAPYYGGGVTPVEPYAFWSNVAPSVGCGFDIREAKLDYDAIRSLVKGWRALNAYYSGDYYPLTPYSQAEDAWIAWQFDRPEQGDGALQAFRRPKCQEVAARLKLHGLEAKATYALSDVSGKTLGSFIGAEAMAQGIEVQIEQNPGAAVLFYRRAK